MFVIHPAARFPLVLSACLCVPACGGESPDDTPTPEVAAAEDWSRDIQSMDLEVNVATLEATATLVIAPSDTSSGLSLEAQGLEILEVTSGEGVSLDWLRDESDGSLDIGVPLGESTLTITYTLTEMDYSFDGYMSSGDSFIWPYYCGNLFPCHSDPADGLRFEVHVSGVPDGQTVVAPTEVITLDAPSYQLGFSVGPYTRRELGTTSAGTSVVFYSLPDDSEADIEAGTGHFRDYIEELEKWFGPYPYGSETGAKTVIWCEEGNCEYAGMEEHPYFDVSDGSIYDPTVFAHEASHAWFGDGTRLECWGEDLVMSEGSASYLEIAILGNVDGENAAMADVQYYQEWLAYSRATGEDYVVWPDTCDEADTYDIWYAVTYSRGALFWYDIEVEVGREALLAAFGDFLASHLGQTTSMGVLLDTVHTSTGFDPWPLAEIWLRSTNLPEGYVLPEVERHNPRTFLKK